MVWFSDCLAVLGSLLGLIVLPALYAPVGNSVTFLIVLRIYCFI